jgi:hypothetical protein
MVMFEKERAASNQKCPFLFQPLGGMRVGRVGRQVQDKECPAIGPFRPDLRSESRI